MPNTTTRAADQQDARRCIQRVRARLEKWELAHLRELAAQLADQVEALQAQLAAAEREAFNAERVRDMYLDLLNEHDEPLGLTQQGQLVRLAPARQVCDDFGTIVEVVA